MRSARNWILATFILTFLVIIAGGVVRTTQSGMGCPDWPRCFGKWIPPTNASELPPDFEKYLRKQDIDHTFNAFHTWVEYINRLLGALLGLFAIIQTAFLFPYRKMQRRPFRLSLLFLLTVIVTGLFGAIVVKMNLQHFSISVHLLFAILLIQVQLALLLAAKPGFSKVTVPAYFRKMIWAFLLIIFCQSVLGTMVRMYVDDISRELGYQQRETWLAQTPVAFLIHRSFSWLVFAGGIALAWAGRNIIQLRNKLFGLAGILLLSMASGITLFYADMPAIAQPVHLLLATFAITQTCYLLFKTRR